MRYFAVFGFNTKQWWVYDEEKDVYIDPPVVVLERLKNLDVEKAESLLTEIANEKPYPEWLFDKDFWVEDDI